MQIAQELSGYSLAKPSSARAMARRSRRDGQAARALRHVRSSAGRKPQADFIFDLLQNSPTTASTSRMPRLTRRLLPDAYLKAHYPVEFLAASMTLDMATPTNWLISARMRCAWHRGGGAVGDVRVSALPSRENKIFYSLAALKGRRCGGRAHCREARRKAFKNLADSASGSIRRSSARRLRKPDHGRALDCFAMTAPR